VDADDERRRLGRERFRQYRERGIQPQTHDMKDEP
jgi:DNA polymerase IIIc chi subunit